MKYQLILLAILQSCIMTMQAGAEPIQANTKTASEAHELIYNASHAMDEAWDAFHKAALGGTLASPEIQTAAESELMQGRSLLRKSRKAQHEGDIGKVRNLTAQIMRLSEEIVIKSQLEKE